MIFTCGPGEPTSPGEPCCPGVPGVPGEPSGPGRPDIPGLPCGPYNTIKANDLSISLANIVHY